MSSIISNKNVYLDRTTWDSEQLMNFLAKNENDYALMKEKEKELCFDVEIWVEKVITNQKYLPKENFDHEKLIKLLKPYIREKHLFSSGVPE